MATSKSPQSSSSNPPPGALPMGWGWGGGGVAWVRSSALLKTAGTTPILIFSIFSLVTLIFCFFQHFQNKVAKIRGETIFWVRWVWVPIESPPPPMKTSWRRPCLQPTFCATFSTFTVFLGLNFPLRHPSKGILWDSDYSLAVMQYTFSVTSST